MYDNNPGRNILGTFETLHEDGWMCVGQYVRNAVDCLDDIFGTGYAKKHPELVGSFIMAASHHSAMSIMSQQLRLGLTGLGSALEIVYERLADGCVHLEDIANQIADLPTPG